MGGLIIAFVSRAMVERVAITAHLVGCGVLSGGVYTLHLYLICNSSFVDFRLSIMLVP